MTALYLHVPPSLGGGYGSETKGDGEEGITYDLKYRAAVDPDGEQAEGLSIYSELDKPGKRKFMEECVHAPNCKFLHEGAFVAEVGVRLQKR